MKFMHCTSCRCLVQENETGTCRGCQMGFIGIPQDDSYEKIKEQKKIDVLRQVVNEANEKEVDVIESKEDVYIVKVKAKKTLRKMNPIKKKKKKPMPRLRTIKK